MAISTIVTMLLMRQLTKRLMSKAAMTIAMIAIMYCVKLSIFQSSIFNLQSSIFNLQSLLITALNCDGIGVENSIGLWVMGW